METSLHEVIRDESGRVRSFSTTVTDLGAERIIETHQQTYVYDASGTLRLMVTTSERDDLGGTEAKAVGGQCVQQGRTYYDGKGQLLRTLVRAQIALVMSMGRLLKATQT